MFRRFTPTPRGLLLSVGLVFLVALLSSLNVAYAGPASTSPDAALITMYQSFFGPMKAFGSALTGSGKVLLFSLVALHIGFGGIKVASGTMDLFELMLQGVKLVIVSGLIYSAMVPQAWLGKATALGGAVTLPGAIVHGFQMMIATAASSAAPAGSGFNFGDITSVPAAGSAAANDIGSAGMFKSIFHMIFTNLDALIRIPLWPESTGTTSTAWVGKIVDMAMSGLGLLISFVYWIGTILMFVLASGMLVLELLGAVFTVQIALAFTPLMVPWLLFKPMSFLFESWLKCIIVGSLAFVIGILMMAGFSAFVTAAVNAIKSVEPGSWTSGPTTAMIFLPLFLGSFLFFGLAPKTMNMASGLISGSGTDGISLHSLSQTLKAASSTTKATSGAIKGTAGLAGGAARGVARGVSGSGGALAAGYKTGKEAYSGAGGGARGIEAGARAMAGSLASGTKERVSSTVSSATDSVKRFAGGESVGMSTAKATASDMGKAPSEQQLGRAASAASTAIRGAQFADKNATEVAAAGQSAARTALSGAPKSGKPVNATPTPPEKPTTPSFPSLPKA